jgi:hypothetical protein
MMTKNEKKMEKIKWAQREVEPDNSETWFLIVASALALAGMLATKF